MRFAGVQAFTPVTRMEVLVDLLEDTPVAQPDTVGGLVALAALMIKGLAVEDADFRRLVLREGGLSEEARALWPHLERRCYTGLSRGDSWGGLAPSEVLGPRGEEASAYLRRELAKVDVRTLTLRDVPVRIDEGLLDMVQPVAFVEELAQTYRDQGREVTLGRWPASHSDTNSQAHAVPAAVQWILAQLGVGAD
jgi:hypothetical protein